MIPSPPLPVEMEQRLRSELNSTEKFIWSGQPIVKGLAIWGSLFQWPLVVIGVPLTTIGVFWAIMTFSVIRHEGWTFPPMAFSSSESYPSASSIFLSAFGIPFGLLGVSILSSPYRVWRKAQKTVYALTDERALILTPTWPRGVSVRSITPEELSPRRRLRNPDGSGSLFFSRLTVWRSGAGPGSGEEVLVGFEHIADVLEVEALIEKTYRVST